jgi:predicted  nucleic acid-binding Zn-ribbon protein
MSNPKHTRNEIMINRLIEYLNDYAGINITDKYRGSHYVFSRTVYFRIAAEYIPETLSNIASAVNRDHSTAIHARKLFKEIENYSVYKNMYNDARAYMDFIEESTVKEHKDNVESSINALAEQVARLNDIITVQNDKLKKQEELLDEIGLEEHEVKYRDLPSEKQYVFKERVNAILKMI